MKYDVFTLGQLVEIKYGKNQKKVQSDDGTVPIYGTGGFMGFATEALYDKPSVLIGRKGTINKVRYVDHPFWTVDTLFYTKINEARIRPKYLYYLMSLLDLDSYNEGTTIPSLRTETLNRLEFAIPNVDYQGKVLSVLEPIDKKIKLNEDINNNLLEQLNQLYAEFSSRSEWSEMTIGDIADKVAMGPFGSNIKVSTFVEYGVPIISGNHLRGYFLEEPSYNYITEEHAEKLKNSVVYPKDIVFTHAGNIGQVAMIPDGCEFPYYVLSQRQFYLRCNTELAAPEYVLLFFHSKKGQHELLSYANQTGVPSIAQPATNLKKIRLPIPPLDEQKDWLSVVAPIIKMYQNNYQETKKLVALRDTLLPKLMSGELDVSNVKI